MGILSNMQHVLVTGVITGILYIISKVVYNVFFHPLSRFPGPVEHKITRLAYSWKAARGTLPFDMLEMHKRYGDIVRIAPDELAFSHPDAWQEIMGHRKGQPEFTKATWFYRPVEDQPTHVVNATREQHGRLRRQLAHGFSEKAMRDQEPLIRGYVDLLLERLDGFCTGDSVALSDWYNFTTFDIIGDLALGSLLDVCRDLIWMGGLKGFLMLGLTVDELIANAEILIIGGSETTASLLSGVTYLLLTNPHAHNKLKDEVRSTFESQADINLVSVNKLSYMLACLDEAMRMYPPIANGLPRLCPDVGATIMGEHIPPNTFVSVHHWALYRRDDYFKDPNTFHPERFLGDDSFADDRREVLQPFHVGPRNCLGRNLAYSEMRLILALIIFNFDITIEDEARDWINQRNFIMWEKGPLKVRLNRV
ncbi:unnamed protein product [Penicillium salamii]|nr:unnamed protein product [Penicillium salamii]